MAAFRNLLILAFVAVLAACAPVYRNHGYVPPDSDLAKVVVGQTSMDQLEENHCRCWKFPGLRELVEFSDIYALTAPRPLMCQNGLQERPTWFTVPLAREALTGIMQIYGVLGAPENLEFVAHEGGHVIEVPALLTFLGKHLGPEQ